MALEFICGFDHFTNVTGLQRKWDTDSNGGSFAGRFGGAAWNTQNNIVGLRQGQLSAVTTRTVGFAFRPLAGFTDNQSLFTFGDGTSTQVDLRLMSDGKLRVTRNGTALATSTDALASATWVYIEFQATIDPAAGAYTLKVWGGASPGVWLTASGVNTRATANSYTNGVWFGVVNYQSLIDDFYCLNSSGSVNNNFLGECRILTTLPSAEGANLAWTPNSGTTHYTQTDDANPDDDSTYVSSATVGQIDTYGFPDIAPTGPIAGVQAVLCDRKDDVGARSICAEYRSSGGANYDGGTAFSPSTSYAMHRQIWESDPATSAAWAAAGVNGGEFGVKVLS